MIYPSGSGLYYAPIHDPGNTLFKIGRDRSLPQRIISESKETLCLSPEKYLNSAILYYLNSCEIHAETIVQRYMDSNQKRYNPGSKKEIFMHVSPEMIETILRDNHIPFQKVSYKDFIENNLYDKILNKECQNYKIVLGNIHSKNEGERERCNLIAKEGFYIRDFLTESNQLTQSARIEYNRHPEHSIQDLKKYTKADFKWDIDRNYLSVINTE